jgi:hypothetical protein
MGDLWQPIPARTHQIGWRDYLHDSGDCAPAVLPPVKRAHCECLQCGELWLGKVGPAICPHCDCDYVRWLDP